MAWEPTHARPFDPINEHGHLGAIRISHFNNSAPLQFRPALRLFPVTFKNTNRRTIPADIRNAGAISCRGLVAFDPVRGWTDIKLDRWIRSASGRV